MDAWYVFLWPRARRNDWRASLYVRLKDGTLGRCDTTTGTLSDVNYFLTRVGRTAVDMGYTIRYVLGWESM